MTTRPRSPTIPLWLQSEVSSAAEADNAWVRELARESGLQIARVTSAGPMSGLEAQLHNSIDAGRLNGLDWFTKERASISVDSRNLMPSAKAIISVGLPYYRATPEIPDDGLLRGRIARYAWGSDYHGVLKKRMTRLHQELERRCGREIEARMLVDTARIVDRAVAGAAGLGWYGKHSCIIVPGYGSWVLLGELVVDLELLCDQALTNNCGRCSICIDSCPTGAITAPYTISAPRCLSFQTIEQRGPIPYELRGLLDDWVFGCDVCQLVCPYTSAAKLTEDAELAPATDRNWLPSLEWLLTMTEAEFREAYRGTAVRRAKRRGLARNAAIALGNSGNERAISLLLNAVQSHDEPLVRGHAIWSANQFDTRETRHAFDRAWSIETDSYVRSELELAMS